MILQHDSFFRVFSVTGASALHGSIHAGSRTSPALTRRAALERHWRHLQGSPHFSPPMRPPRPKWFAPLAPTSSSSRQIHLTYSEFSLAMYQQDENLCLSCCVWDSSLSWTTFSLVELKFEKPVAYIEPFISSVEEYARKSRPTPLGSRESSCQPCFAGWFGWLRWGCSEPFMPLSKLNGQP